ncbi:histone-lysine N-methyltransferase 2D-like isoform X2 [Syngnathus typhle]|uniref:histone-lysine N-methyltransferase 2D-like isoform X2 n=1 Tax=Syngnathus typhle TaxID=161592 RepID=UPI002A6AF6B9|nr:histone-lysine N-methyltransferase 2D-like isoform X2 [Syngnathus typhle]
MNPHQNVAYSNTSRLAVTGTRERVSRFSDHPPTRVPGDFRENVVHMPMRPKPESNTKSASVKMMAAHSQTRPVKSTPGKWKSSFKPIDGEDPEDESQKQSTEERTDIYDPFDPPMEDLPNATLGDISCDSPPGDENSPEKDDNVEWQSSPPEKDDNVEWQSSPFEEDDNVEWQPSPSEQDDNVEWQRSPSEQDDNLEWQRSPPEQDDNLEWQRSPSEQDGNLAWQRSPPKQDEWQPMSPDRRSRNVPPWMLGRALDIHDFSFERRRDENPSHLRLSEQQSYSPDLKSIERRSYESTRISFSPDRRLDGSSSQRYSGPYAEERINGKEEMTRAEYRTPMIPRVRLSSPRLERDYEIKEPDEAEPERRPPTTRIKRKMRKSVKMDQITINCDLCDIELSNGQELEKHLQSKIHWDTMEHIQEQNNYDDLTIAFLQDVMVYKSIKCSRAIEHCALQGEGPHDKGGIVPLRGVPGAGVHGRSGRAESHHLYGTPLQHQRIRRAAETGFTQQSRYHHERVAASV